MSLHLSDFSRRIRWSQTWISTKGLEFPVVFLPGMEEGLFPGMQTMLGGPGEMEEERRLAYVAITRAKDMLFITHTKKRMLYGRTSVNPISPFVDEIPEKLIKKELPAAYTRSEYSAPRTYIANSQPVDIRKPPSFQRPTVTKSTPKAGLDLKEGDRVRHAAFGDGEVLSATPMGADVLYEIVFDKVGTKKLMATYAKLTEV